MRLRFLNSFIVVMGLAVSGRVIMPGDHYTGSAELVRFEHLTPNELRGATLVVTDGEPVQVTATGADENFPNHKFISSTGNSVSYSSAGDPDAGWRGNAWILDAATREPVWELRTASTERVSKVKGLRSFNGTVRLKPGTYEVYYASYSAYRTEIDGDKNCHSSSAKCTVTHYYDDGVSENFSLVLTGNGRVEPSIAPQSSPNAVATLRDVPANKTRTAGFSVDRPTRVTVYSAGEVRDYATFDYGWIINAETRERVWGLDYDNSEAAGGARKNRVARETITLPAGRYAAVYTMDDSHGPGDWNQGPPLDPQAWGMTIETGAADRAQVHAFEYSATPPNSIVAITRVGNDETLSKGFSIDRPMDVRILAFGEATSSEMSDYGWITDARTHRRIWSMTFDRTQHAGGDKKNRIESTTLHLEPGAYLVNYRTDSSHSYDAWNAGPPIDGELWGITVSAADAADRNTAKSYDEEPEAASLAQIVKVGDNAHKRASFHLDADGDVRVYALGEGTGGDMDDYGWIEDSNGRVVWEMTYRMTEPAGGAAKNRMYDSLVHLSAGQYVAHYKSDDSNSYRDWNSDAPDDPSHWGITVYAAKASKR